MKNFAAGVATFFIGATTVIIYAALSPYKSGADVAGTISALNILFTLLFFICCCIAAFVFGKKRNKGGLIGLISIFALPYLALLLSFIPSIRLYMAMIFFSYTTLFLIILPYFAFIAPVVMIVFVILLWSIGKRRYNHIN